MFNLCFKFLWLLFVQCFCSYRPSKSKILFVAFEFQKPTLQCYGGAHFFPSTKYLSCIDQMFQPVSTQAVLPTEVGRKELKEF